MDKKTALYDTHINLKAKMVPFGGFSMPIEYQDSGVLKEHLAVRNEAGIFDVSHMGEFFIEGEGAVATLQKIFTNDFSKMKNGGIRYTLMCNEKGGIIEDLLVYKYSDQKFMLVVNAANHDKDFNWIQEHLLSNTTLTDRSEEIGLLAVQGPRTKEIFEKICRAEELPEKYYTFKENVEIAGVKADISRTGYTGEFGYEVYCRTEDLLTIFEKIMAAGEPLGLLPSGLGARDTLRLEAGMPLYGHEMNEDITPVEVDLGFAVKLAKEDFIGKDAIAAAQNSEKVRVGLEVVGRGIVREEAELLLADEKVGFTTSGTFSPSMKKGIAMAFVDRDKSEIGTVFDVKIRNRVLQAKIVTMPFNFKNQ
ncbi:glycine cleavage system aminomethyltransferase GcvT [Vagococcus elongatus]|uniref:Aminomethyltransferase n=1 Tax=Vagococcus elongatus TaxID=180344 RepID=A0A430AX48_9ENTE|nr:glycine cleavage system aminomethyltransferase GcvT [Vagococcus elongatus]RSU12651.1 glycine cleavage system protein T [Vagococcus elongatus]